MKFGAHVSIAGGIDKAPARAHELGCECFQIFTRSPRGGQPPKLDIDLIDSFLKNCSEYKLKNYYVHTPYYINFASDNPDIRKSSVRIVKEELERSDLLGVKHIMTHLGSSKGIERSEAIERVATGISKILEHTDTKTTLLLENSAGQGDTIGEKFEEIAEILYKVNYNNLGVCLDTAHTFAAGYDIRDNKSISETLEIFNSTIGLKYLRLIHGNDSKVGLGEKKDRHEHIGKGKIAKKGFKTIVNNNHLKSLDMIIETPPEGVKKDIEVLKNLRLN